MHIWLLLLNMWVVMLWVDWRDDLWVDLGMHRRRGGVVVEFGHWGSRRPLMRIRLVRIEAWMSHELGTGRGMTH